MIMLKTEDNSDISSHSSPQDLLIKVEALLQQVEAEGQIILDQWELSQSSPKFMASARNLAHYLALRHQDLRGLQSELMPWGLSSLGRMESRVLLSLKALIHTLECMCQNASASDAAPFGASDFFSGDGILQKNTRDLFGIPTELAAARPRRVKIMVTLPKKAAIDEAFVYEILKRGANCVRINCAHDSASVWADMIANVRRAEAKLNVHCSIMMDLSGPKIRTGLVHRPPGQKRVFANELIFLSRTAALYPESNQIKKPQKYPIFQITCSIPEILDLLTVDMPVYIDDGKIRTIVVDQDYQLKNGARGLLLRVTHGSPKGTKIRAEKGLNFPQTHLPLSALTSKDLADLDFVARHADIVGYSFVQQAQDLALLQEELEHRCSDSVAPPAIVAKIETAIAVKNLPELIVQAAKTNTFGVMIARGDLAVEIGYQRLAEIQEEILWICEAAHVPVIWATQVLESLVKNGVPARGEMTDAAMAERAECVMLNKGPFIAEAVTILDDVLCRMETHQRKKIPQLRALTSW